MGAIRREMNSTKWFRISIGYQCGFAYLVSMCINQIGGLLTGQGFGIFTAISLIVVAVFIYLLVRPYHESKTLKVNLRSVDSAKS